MTPLLCLPVTMYSASKNVLTGVIESSDTLIIIAKMYTKTLIWYCVQAILKQKIINDTKAEESNEEEIIQMLPHSSSIEAMNLESWPSSAESSTVPPQLPTSRPYVGSGSSESSPSLFEEEIPKKRKGWY